MVALNMTRLIPGIPFASRGSGRIAMVYVNFPLQLCGWSVVEDIPMPSAF
jgi:hypothetical protein